MVKVNKMSNVSVAIESALGAAKTITAISKAAPGVVTATHDYSNGDYILLATNVSQLDGRVFRVCNVSTTVSFQLEDINGGTGIDTTAIDTFVSGTAKKITFGTSITTAADIQVSGGDFGSIDTTLVHSNQKTEIPGAANPVSLDVTHLWDVSSPGQIALKAASDAGTTKAFKLVYGIGGSVMVFAGTVGHAGVPNGGAQEKLTTKSTLKVSNQVTYYAV